MLHIDPASCVDCGACVSACPVDAIVPHTKLLPAQREYEQINADFYRDANPRTPLALIPISPTKRPAPEPLSVAVVGSGPAAMYVADELLKQRDIHVNVFERLSSPYGLARYGVAPDHQSTRKVADLFDHIAAHPHFRLSRGVDVGVDISHADILRKHNAVVYAVGASADRRLDIVGEDLDGSVAATEFVAWYNGHPDFVDKKYNLDHKRVVIVGNGNVALDMARILTTPPDELASTSIAPHALAALRTSKVEEVVILGRRGVAQAAYTLPEILGLARKHSAHLVVDPGELHIDEATANDRANGTLRPSVERKLDLANEIATTEIATTAPPERSQRRIVFRYLVSPTEILGTNSVNGIVVERNALVAEGSRVRAVGTGQKETIEAGLVIRSVGYRGRTQTDLPFDDSLGVIPNSGGRVTGHDGDILPAVYVAGWIKRGPSGFIGTNKSCAKETVDNLIEDFNVGKLPTPAGAPVVEPAPRSWRQRVRLG
ncbi:ferredoxin [Hoyosella rhizosphaerae]|uniref:ferredoxin--NADP(+) reductase n=2 Tax=Hoyosella rhizosphaerae TaxID=1755582 RepID=A0A916XBM4_9ACTN|nr:ferredoxin [Hoyosella rhizosphaerae]